MSDNNFPSDATTARLKLVDNGSAPVGYLDGKEITFESLYKIEDMRKLINDRLKVDSPLEITNSTSESASAIGITNTSSSAVTGKLYVILLEDSLDASKSDWDVKTAFGIARKAINAAAGEDVTIEAGQKLQKNYTYTFNSAWKKDKCKCIAFVQKSDKDVVQVKEVKIGAGTGINEPLVQKLNQSSVKVVRNVQSNGVTLSFNLTNESPVSVSVYNARGTRVGFLSIPSMKKGSQSIVWDMKNSSNMQVPNGVYYFKVETEGFRYTAKTVL